MYEKSLVKQSLKREKGAVIYVREMENNAGGRRQTKVSLLCMLQLNKTPACLPACLPAWLPVCLKEGCLTYLLRKLVYSPTVLEKEITNKIALGMIKKKRAHIDLDTIKIRSGY